MSNLVNLHSNGMHIHIYVKYNKVKLINPTVNILS